MLAKCVGQSGLSSAGGRRSGRGDCVGNQDLRRLVR
jgi:hypothetical protein